MLELCPQCHAVKRATPCPICNGTGYAPVTIGEAVDIHDPDGRLSPAVVTHIYADGSPRVKPDGSQHDYHAANLITKRCVITIDVNRPTFDFLNDAAGDDSIVSYLLRLARADADARGLTMPEDTVSRRGARGKGRRKKPLQVD